VAAGRHATEGLEGIGILRSECGSLIQVGLIARGLVGQDDVAASALHRRLVLADEKSVEKEEGGPPCFFGHIVAA
jgi:hypothetical protein